MDFGVINGLFTLALLLAFLGNLYLEADQSGDPYIKALKVPVVATLKQVP